MIGPNSGRIGLRTALALGAVYVLWGSTFLAIRIGVGTIPPFLMSGLRWLLAGTSLYAFARLRGAERPTGRQWLSAVGLGALLVYCSNGGVTWAETRVPSGLAALFIASVSFWMVLLDWVRPGGTRPHGRVLMGVVLGFIGVALLSGRHGEGLHVDALGLVALLLSALAWSVGSLASRRAALPKAPLLSASMQMLAGAALLLTTSVLTGETRGLALSRVSAASMVSVVYLAVFGSLVGFTLYLWLMRVASPAVVSTYACVNPVVAVLLGWAFLHEPITPRMLLATFVIVGSVALVVSSRGKAAENEAGPKRETLSAPESPTAEAEA